MTPWATPRPGASLESRNAAHLSRTRSRGGKPKMTVIDPTISPLDVPAAEKARMWAEDRLVLLKAATERRLIERATQNGHGPAIGEPTVGAYVAFDVACT